MAAGRPTSYDPKYCEEVVKFLAGGFSVTAFAGSIGVSRATVFNWAKDRPEFFDALKAGQAAAANWWENALQNVAKGGEGNATACIFGLKNRSAEDWADKVVNEHTGKDGGPIQTEELSDHETARRVAFLLAKGLKD